jgi:hypothetical protein
MQALFVIRAVRGLAAIVFLLLPGAAANAAGVRLLMVEQAGCRYCIDWDREIGPKYPMSAEGRFAPLHRVKREDASLRDFKPVIYTPTFLVVQDGREVGRVTGYAGKLFFWEELDEQLVKAGFKPDWSIPDAGKATDAGAKSGSVQSMLVGSASNANP